MGEDIFGGFGPDEGLRPGVVLDEVRVDCSLQIIDAVVTAPADAPGCDLGEESFDHVQPGRAGWREMQLEARAFVQPGLHLGRLVGRIIVEHEMDVARLEDGAVNPSEEGRIRR